MTKQLTSGQGGGIESRGGRFSTVQRGGLFGRTPMMHTEQGARMLTSSELGSLRPGEVHEMVKATWNRGRGDLDMGSLSIRRGRWDIRIVEAMRRTFLP